jgi:hypothetical protein
MKKQPNGWRVVIFWIGGKCQSKGHLIIMKCWGNPYASFVVFFLFYCCFVELCFAFFMVVTMFGVDQVGILHCFGAGDWWRMNVAVYEEASYIVKLSSYIRVWVCFFFFHFFSLVVFKFADVCLLGVFLAISSKHEVCEGGMP